MISKLKSISLIVSLAFCFAGFAFGQAELVTITGTVVDPNNAVVPGATVTARGTATGFTRSATTNEEGVYTIANIQPGTYEITITGGNFPPVTVRRDIAVGGTARVDVTLSPTATAVVEVQAGQGDVAEINVSDQTVSEVIGQKQITGLPTISRDPYAFIVTLGNVSETGAAGRGVGVTLNGQRAASTNILLNGGENVDVFTATPGQTVPLESVQEYRAVTGTFTADLGRATGGVVNLVTLSGQNRFFGSLYAFNRNSRFASAGFDANARAVPGGPAPLQFFNRNVFGGKLGGPIVRDKLLFFTNTELTRIRSTANRFALVPSAASIAAAAPATQAFFAGYQLAARPTGRTQSLAGTTPGRTLIFNEVQYSVPADVGAGTPVDGVTNVNRIDWNINNRVQIYGVYSLERSTFLEGSNASSPYAGFSTGAVTDNTNIQVVGNYQIANNLVGVSRVTFNRLDQDQPLGSQPAGPTLYLRSTAQRIGGTLIGFPGYLPFNPGSAIPFGGPQTFLQLAQEINWVVGDHALKFGGQFFKIRDQRVFGAYQNSVQTLGASNAQAVENFFNGVLFSFQGAVNPQGRFPGQTLTLPVGAPQFGRDNRYTEWNAYAQDSFKLFPNFTAVLGLRYEYYGPQRNVDPTLDANFYLGSGANRFQQIRNGTVQRAPNSPIGELWAPDKNNFAPSVGFAYDIEGNGRSSLRAGYALRYERNFGNVTFNVIQNPPNYGVISITSADIGGNPIPITRNNAGPLAGSTGSVTLPRVSLRAVDPNIVNAYAHQYSASYERRFGNVTASAVFSGTTGKKLYSIENINRFGSGTTYLGSNGTCPGLAPVDRLNGCYGNINFRSNSGYSAYQGITFSLESGNLFGAGLTMATRYTYSVARDNLTSTFSETGNQFNLGFLDPFNPSLDYGFADSDVRHRFVSSFVWDLPTNRLFDDGIGRTIFGGFTLSGIVVARTGSPFSVYDCSEAFDVCKYLIANGSVPFEGRIGNDTGAANEFEYIRLTGQTARSVGGVIPANNGGPFPENMTARNSFRGPGFWNVDLALAKRFNFTERVNLQLRMDVENAFNRANPFVNGYSGGTDISAGNVVTVSKFGRRLVQFGVRFGF